MPSIASGRLNIATVIDCQTTITEARSYRVSPLVIRNDAANTGDEDSMRRVYSPPVPVSLGATTISTPASPISAATQRSQRMRSPSNQAAPIMMKIGPVKPMAVVSASVMCGMAVNHRHRPNV